MEGFYLALGVTFVLPFLQWAVPTMPRILAYAGVAGGIIVMLAEFLDPTMKPPFGAVILFLIGILCIGGAAHLYMQALKSPKTAEKVADTPAATFSPPDSVMFDAKTGGKISAQGAQITPDLPFNTFAKAESGGQIIMDGVKVVRDQPKNSPNITAGGNITIGNIGDTTVNQAPKPELKFGGSRTQKNPDGTYTATLEAEIVSPYPPATLLVEAWNAGIVSFDAIPQRSGLAMGGPSGVRSDHAFATMVQPFGKVHFVVVTKDVPHIELRYDFDK
jgi:hypothetical protein